MTPRPARPDLRAERRAAILAAAAEVFAESGYRRARVADVAARAGIGKGTIYEYFRSKQELFLAVFDWWVEGIMAGALATVDPAGDPVVALRSFIETTLAELEEMLPVYPLTLEFWAAAAGSEFGERLQQELRDMYRRFGGVVTGIVQLGMDSGAFGPWVRPEAVARTLVGAIDGLFLQAWLDPDFDARAAGGSFLDALLRGLTAEAGPAAEPAPGKGTS